MMQAARAVGLALLAFGSLEAAAFAQSEAPAAYPRWSFSAAHEYSTVRAFSTEHTALPPNLSFSSVFRSVLEMMLQRSPTFQRQCRRIAAESRASIHVIPVTASRTHGARAMTRFTHQKDGRLQADIEIGPLENDVELIAHELEHVIEQLDDIDLAAKAAQPDSGVESVAGDVLMFETRRAAHVGVIVAQEVRAAVPRGD